MAVQDYFTDFCMLDKRTVSDGMGGVTPTYTEGAKFKAGISTNQSNEAKIAYQQGLKVMYTLVFMPTITLENGDRIPISRTFRDAARTAFFDLHRL